MTLAERLRAQLTDGHARQMTIENIDPRIMQDIALAPAAVLIAVTDRQQPGVILTRRSSKLRKHAGQVAFPGGRVDPGDKDVVAAALREAWEEIALEPDAVEVVGTSDSYHTFTGFDIIPVLGVIPPDLPLHPHEAEVEALFEVPLDFLFSPANRVCKEVELQGVVRQYYEIMWEDFRIWGITATIIANLSRRLGYDDSVAA